MKLNKQTEKEVLQVYDTWLHSYLHGDVATYDSYFDDEYHFIGSTGNEEFLSRKDTTKFFENTADQLAGKCDLRKETRILEQFGELVFITHVFDAWFLNGTDYSYYGRFRFTNILQENKDGWRFIYQHFSTPDSKTEEGETIGFDKVNAENQELREAIKRRTIELERKNRELEIETAVEKVRAEAMAMQSSEDFHKVAAVLWVQVNQLNINGFAGTGIALFDDDGYINWWDFSSPGNIGKHKGMVNRYEYEKYPLLGLEVWEAYQKGEPYFVLEYDLPKLKRGIKEWEVIKPAVAEGFKEAIASGKLTQQWGACGRISGGFLFFDQLLPPDEDSKSILLKMATAFELAYQRFLDLQKAEAQAREAQIEASLERVRAYTMAMHNSDDVGKCIVEMFGELTALGVDEGTRFGIGILNHDNESNQLWTASKDGEEVKMLIGTLDMTLHPLLKSARKAWKEQVSLHTYVLEGEDLVNYYQVLNDAPDYNFKIALEELPERQFHYGFLFDHGFFYAFNPCEFQPGLIHTIQRFSSLFGQTYRRYLDLVKAEEQTREAKIEVALERIRSQATSMQQSTDLLDVVVSMRNEFIKLGHEAHYFWHMLWSPDKYEKAMTSGDGTRIGFVMELPRHMHGDIPLLANWEKGTEPTVVYAMDTDEAIDYVDKMVALGDFKNIDPNAPSHDDIRHIGGLTFIMARTTHGEIGYSLPGPVPDPPVEDLDILVRFAGAFDLAHRRFLDLQKAEALARETQVELSLERIRAQVTAMQESSDLFDIVVSLRNEFLSLGHEADYFWHMRWMHDQYEMSMTSEDGSRMGMIITVPKFVHDAIPSLAAWEKSKEPAFVLALDADGAWDYIDKMNTYGSYKQADPHAPTREDIEQIGGLTFIIARTTHGEIGFSLAGKVDDPPQASIDTLIRFAAVFDLAYKRFEDLKAAERQHREAQIELALEKVRSRTMAMQHSDELPEAANLLFLEVQKLGFPTWSAGYNILSDDKTSSTCIMSSEGELQVPFILPLTEHESLLPWHQAIVNEEDFFVYSQEGDDLVAHYDYMKSLPELKRTFEQFENAGLDLPTQQFNHLVRFSKGFLLFITYQAVPEAHDIFKRFGTVFEQTYTRFLDLQTKEEQAIKLEQEKQRLEKTLHDLRLTQKQLIQSEKMASLGELTAGIAHEIQNPLNFVNNFSEVSAELLDEMNEEMENGDLDEVKAIALDIKQNLEKINHHGKRADAIVKGMLQHSRQSTAEKAATDINKLADEYLRLAYHGLRAKDKSFNAVLHTDFDPTLEKVMVIPQDMGRVVLNLFNNAFYAVNEKKIANGQDYEPTVSISTRRSADRISISVKDNGNGISKDVADKIFQPFFTTKPTGKGTGLGLSLSYDIVKAHGGEISLKSAVNEGSEFVISLPVK